MSSMKISPALALGSLLILGGAASAQPQPNASEIIKQVSSVYQNFRSFHFEAQCANEERKDGVTTRSESKRIYAHDGQGRVRIEFKNPSIEFLNLFDGVTRWTYFPASREYSAKIPENPNNITDGPIVDFMITTIIVSDILTRYAEPESDSPLRPAMRAMRGRPMETVEIGDRKIPAYVVEIEYSMDQAGRELRRTLWIDQLRFIVLRDLAIRKENLSGKTTELRTLVNLTIAKVNEELPGDLFAFRPPPNARQVETPSSPLKDLGDLDILSKAMYSREADAADTGGPLLQGIPGGVGISTTRKSAPLTPEQLRALGVEQGKAIKKPQPKYPPGPEGLFKSSTVNVRITIDEKGNVIDAVMISGDSFLKDVSLRAARQWKFEPTLLNGAPIKVETILTFAFFAR